MSPMDEDESAAVGAHLRASAEQGSVNVCWGHGRTLSGAGGCSSTGLPGCVSPVLTNTADTNGSRQADSCPVYLLPAALVMEFVCPGLVHINSSFQNPVCSLR